MVRLVPAVLRLCLVAAIVVCAAGCGHTIDPGVKFQYPPPYDFTHPPCSPAARPAEPVPDGQVVLRYLGAGGLYIGWRGEAILTAPYFSNPGMLRSLGRLHWNRAAIARGTDGLPGERIGAILAGHSHYDHIGDLPPVARELAPRARIYLNNSGVRALEGFRDLRLRATRLEDLGEESTQLFDAARRPLPFRVRPVKSEHAPHLLRLMLWGGDGREIHDEWQGLRYSSLKAGQVYAFVIDLLESAREDAPAVFRIYAQDSAARNPHGVPKPAPDDRPYDLAVLCMASAHLVEPSPQELLEVITPRRVLVTHYESFFHPWGPNRGFVINLTPGRANRFLRRVQTALEKKPAATIASANKICGPSALRWTMPLTGEWMIFPVGPDHAGAPL